MKKQIKAHNKDNNAKNIEMKTRARDGFLNQKKTDQGGGGYLSDRKGGSGDAAFVPGAGIWENQQSLQNAEIHSNLHFVFKL